MFLVGNRAKTVTFDVTKTCFLNVGGPYILIHIIDMLYLFILL